MKSNAWFLIEMSEDLPNTWVAHCLDLDVVAYGSSLDEAVRMGIETAEMALSDDLAAGLDSRRRRAPQEDWDRFYQLMGEATKRIPVGALGQSEVRYAIITLELNVVDALDEKGSTEEPRGFAYAPAA